MTQLTNKQLYITPPMPASPPAIMVQFVKPLSYEFRVAEHYDAEEKLQKVGLQVQIWEHDEYGVGVVKQYWSDVERVKIPYIPPIS
jgi:hypothetical protein